ncbi:MAG TPA: YgiQ family radical SAM protein, partial [Anaerolineaceae bacterium]|nr:YgiQ family radical SAM protein [Anaerolineaceae bacterium]
MFIPTTPQEVAALDWDPLDVILVSGDTYIDSPYSGAALIGKQLMAAGYRVGIIAQPEVNSATDIMRLGEPRLFWGVTGGAVDSMVSNYTALGKPRRSDDYPPGGVNNRRPDRAVIVYANLIRRYFKHTAPIVLGGVEASLRRVVHYDYWSDSLRRSILLDAKAD